MSFTTVTKCSETKYCHLTGMMGTGMNGMAGSPAPGNFMQQVSVISEYNPEFTYFSTLYEILDINIDNNFVPCIIYHHWHSASVMQPLFSLIVLHESDGVKMSKLENKRPCGLLYTTYIFIIYNMLFL